MSPIRPGSDRSFALPHSQVAPIVDEPEDTMPTGEEVDRSAEGRIQTTRVIGRPPSEREVREHNRLHMPYRSWCPICISAKGTDVGHKSQSGRAGECEERREVSLDYCFLKDAVGGPTATVLVGRDRQSGLYVGHVVPSKGAATEWIAAQVERDLRKMGYFGSVVLKSDHEPAILDLLSDVARRRGSVRTVLESAPRGDSQGNGHAERAVRSVEEMVRLQKLALEGRIGAKVGVDHKVFA